MESLHREKFPGYAKDYIISIIRESDGDIITTILEVQPNREVAVDRVNYGQTQEDLKKLIEDAMKKIRNWT